jgi:hypothetical protein
MCLPEGNACHVVTSTSLRNLEQATMKKQPLFDVSLLNRIADKHNVPWIDRIPLIESVCWGSKGWLDSALVAKLRGRWNGYRRNAEYGAFMGEVMSALSAPFLADHRFPSKDWQPSQAQLASIGG